jgi:hypothetical protein
MEEHAKEIIAVLLWAVIAGGGLFLTVIGWIGSQLHAQLKEIVKAQGETNKTLSAIERDLRKDLSALDRRVTVLETDYELRRSD